MNNVKEFLKRLDDIIENIPLSIEEKKRKFFAIIVKSLKEKNILSEEDLNKIANLDIL